MGQFITPKAFLIAETKVDRSVLEQALAELNVMNWQSAASNDAALLTEFAGKSCYLSFDTALNDNLTQVNGRSSFDYLQQAIIGNRHGSVLEHSTVSFFLTNVSRVVTHELVRHRAGAAYSQTSGRYVRTDQVNMYLPAVFRGNTEAEAIFTKAIGQMEENANALANLFDLNNQPFSFKKLVTSAIRRLIGNGQANHIVVTANHRAWRHMLVMRTDPAAEEEIRVVFAELSRQLRTRYPELYADAIISVVDGVEVTTFQHEKV